MSIAFENSKYIVYTDSSFKNDSFKEQLWIDYKLKNKKKVRILKHINPDSNRESEIDFIYKDEVFKNADNGCEKKYFDNSTGCGNFYTKKFEECIKKLLKHLGKFGLKNVVIYDAFGGNTFNKLFNSMKIIPYEESNDDVEYDLGFNSLWCGAKTKFSINVFLKEDFIRLNREVSKSISIILNVKDKLFEFDDSEYVIALSRYNKTAIKTKTILNIDGETAYQECVEINNNHLEQSTCERIDALGILKEKYLINQDADNIEALKFLFETSVRLNYLNTRDERKFEESVQFLNKLDKDNLLKIRFNKLFELNPSIITATDTAFIILDNGDFRRVFKPCKCMNIFKFKTPVNVSDDILKIISLQISVVKNELISSQHFLTERSLTYDFFKQDGILKFVERDFEIYINSDYNENLTFNSPQILSESTDSDDEN